MSMTLVDVLIAGAGVQGLALLEELSRDFSVVVVGANPVVSETLHSHGYFSSGWNAANIDAAAVYLETVRLWTKRLRDNGLSAHESSFHAALPAETAARLEPNWQKIALRYEAASFPVPFTTKNLPPHQALSFPEDVIFDSAAAAALIRNRLGDRVVEGKVTDVVVEGRRVTAAAVDVGGEICRIAPGFFLSACGAGNARMLQRMGLPAGAVANCQMVRPLHMVCARGEALPNVSGFFLELVVISHPTPGAPKTRTWLITYNPPEPGMSSGVVDMRSDPMIDPEVVRKSLERLSGVLPGFEEVASACEWDVYTGWKTDAPGGDAKALVSLDYPQPFDVRDFGVENFLAVWPNHWCLSTKAAKRAADVVRSRVTPRCKPISLPKSPGKAVSMKWARGDRRWRRWSDFAREFGFRPDSQ